MKKTIKNTLLLAVLSAGLFSCSSHTTSAPPPQYNNVTVQAPQPQAPQNISVQPSSAPQATANFDVNQFAGLLQSTSSPDVLTQAINAPGNTINTLDLDNDGNVDYLRVNQVSDYSMQVVDETSTQRMVVATLTVNPQLKSYSVVGTPTYCGNSYMYNSPTGLSLSDIVFIAWLTHPHAIYHPSWGYHTHYYRGYAPARRTTSITTTTITKTSSGSGSNQNVAKAPVKSVAPTPAPTPRPTVSNASSSQKQFNTNEGDRFRANNSANAFKPKPQPQATAPAPKPRTSSYGTSKSGFGKHK